MELKSGLLKIKPDHRDYNLLPTFGLTSIPAFPLEYSTDLEQWMPSQNAMGAPFGCTGFAGADACSDDDGVIYDPLDLYRRTPPYRDMEGREMRAMLDVTVKEGLKCWLLEEGPGYKRTAYFQIRAAGFIDSFDAIRLAMISTRVEGRAVIAGIPWYLIFQATTQSGIMHMPYDLSRGYTWHAVKIAGWTTIHGVPYLKIKSWQGPNFGDQGWCYMSRELANILLTTSGAAAFTLTKVEANQIVRVDLDAVAIITSYFRRLYERLFN